MKITKILVGVDFDINNSQLIKLSFDLAQNCNAQLTFIHCYHPSAIDVKNEIRDPEKYYFQELLNIIEPIGSIYNDVDFGFEVLSNFAIQGILDYKNENEYDFLILGKRKNDSWIPIKSNSISVSEKSNIPTLIVPESYRMTDFNHVVFNVEFEFIEIDVIYDLLLFCKGLGAILSCVHVADIPNMEKAKNNMMVYQKLFEGQILEEIINFEVLKKSNGREIENFAKDNEGDILVLSKTRRTWKNQYLKSKEEEISRQMSIPILLINF